MAKIRKAHTVELIERRLKDVETSTPDPMELIGLYDELARLERKWREQIAEGSERRQPNDIPRLNAYFDRLLLQIDASLRQSNLPPVERSLLLAARDATVNRGRA